jgi:hypothetical protein
MSAAERTNNEPLRSISTTEESQHTETALVTMFYPGLLALSYVSFLVLLLAGAD